MPSRRKQTVGSCQFAQGHCWSTPCGGAGNLTEGSSLHRVQPSFCLEAYCPSLTVRTQPKINPPSCWFSLLCLSQWTTCVDWAASIQHCNSSFITKRIDKKHQPSVSAMMCIFDGISMALQIHHLVCLQLRAASCAHRQIEPSVSHFSFPKIVLLITSFLNRWSSDSWDKVKPASGIAALLRE